MKYSALRTKFQNMTGMLEVSVRGENRIEITNELALYVNRNYVGRYKNMAECRREAEKYLETKPVIKESQIAYFIKEHTATDRITTDIINKYRDIILSKQFTLDEVVLQYRKANTTDKIDFILEDKSIVLVNAETLTKLNESDVDFMRKSQSNFTKTVRKIK